jgi:hypothetical protein
MALKSISLLYGNGDIEIYGENIKTTVKFNQRVQKLAREIGINPTRKFVKRFSPNRHKEGIRILCSSKNKTKSIQRVLRKLETEIYDITKIPEPYLRNNKKTIIMDAEKLTKWSKEIYENAAAHG